MNCKNCGAKADGDQRYCPVCGEELNPRKEQNYFDTEDADAADELTAHSETDEASAIPALSGGPDSGVKSPGRKKTSKLGAAITAAVLILAIVAGLVGSGLLNFDGLGGQADNDQIVATMGNYKLNNQQLAYYYWNQVYYLENSYYSQYGITLSQLMEPGVPFAEQEYYTDEYATWHDYFLEMAIENWVFTVAVAELAKNEDHVLNDMYATYMANFEQNTMDDAAAYGYDSVAEMLAGDFGDTSDVDSYRAFQEERFLASSYSYSIYETALNALFDELEMTSAINIRHILIKTETAETDEDKAALKARAEEIYAEWQLDATEANFAVMAGEYTEDGGSAYSGGLYEEVAPGDMVVEFNDWCFEEGRKVGDSGIVETVHGYHIMYFSGFGEEQVPADGDAATQAGSQAQDVYMQWLNDLFESLDYDVKYDRIALAKTFF